MSNSPTDVATAHVPTQNEFDTFTSIDLINHVAEDYRWTVSDHNKVPMDMRAMTLDYTAEPKGAASSNERCLLPRQRVIDFFSSIDMRPTNLAFKVDLSERDPFIVLDIESKCPPEQAHHLIETLPWVYAERSASGKGFHLVLPTPWPTPHDKGYLAQLIDDTREYEKTAASMWSDLTQRRVIRRQQGDYEALLDHYTTFTMNCSEFPEPPEPTIERLNAWHDILTDLIENAPEPVITREYTNAKGEVVELDVSFDRPDYVHFDYLIETLMSRYRSNPYAQTPEDFDGDMSRWEFGMISSVMHMARSTMREVMRINRPDRLDPIDENTFIWVVYTVISKLIPLREKHYGYREKLPYLLYRTKAAFATQASKVDPLLFSREDAMTEAAASFNWSSITTFRSQQ